MYKVHIQVNLNVKVAVLSTVFHVVILKQENVDLVVLQIIVVGVGHLDLIHKIVDVVMNLVLLQI